MRANAAAGPAWLWATFQGVFFAVFMTVWSVVSYHRSWEHTLVSAAVIALLFTLLMCVATRGARRADAEILKDLTPEQRREVVLAATTNAAPPSDSALWPPAAAMVRRRLIEHERHPVAAVVVPGLFAVLATLMAVIGAFWYLAATAVFCWSLIWEVRYPRRLRRRLAALEPAWSLPGSASLV